MPEITKSLTDLHKANEKLNEALDQTILAWPYNPYCWIDQINDEPTPILQQHRLKYAFTLAPKGDEAA